MKRFLLSRIWGYYSEIVHQTLFFEVVTHGLLGLLAKLLAAIATMAEDQQMIAAFSFALMLSFLKAARDAHKGEVAGRETREKDSSQAGEKYKVPQPRDKYGRFVKRRKKRKP